MNVPTVKYTMNCIANTFLDRGFREKLDITPMKLQKLVYFFHGWHLAITGKPGIPCPVEAWPYGPVVPALYHEFKRYVGAPISSYANDVDPETGNSIVSIVPLDEDAKFAEIFDAVWEKYGNFTGVELSSLAHEDGSPWSLARKKGMTVIPNSSIKEYFVNLVRSGSNG